MALIFARASSPFDASSTFPADPLQEIANDPYHRLIVVDDENGHCSINDHRYLQQTAQQRTADHERNTGTAGTASATSTLCSTRLDAFLLANRLRWSKTNRAIVSVLVSRSRVRRAGIAAHCIRRDTRAGWRQRHDRRDQTVRQPPCPPPARAAMQQFGVVA